MGMVNQGFSQLLPGTEAPHTEFVPVVFAADLEEAQAYRAMLEAYNIPVLLDSERGGDRIYSTFSKAVPVLVPDHLHDQASNLVAEAERVGLPEVLFGEDGDDGDYADDDFDEDDDDDDLDEDDDEDFDDDEFEDDFDDEEEEEEEEDEEA
jgi:hypothetical protein